MDVERIAMICHETNRTYCQTLGDHSHMRWEDAPDWQRESAINGVKFYLGFPNAGPSALHNSWMHEKLTAGWKYGPVKDAEKKEHPCLVPFRELSLDEQRKDMLFAAIVDAFRRV